MSAHLVLEFERRFPRGVSLTARATARVEPPVVTVLFGPSGAGKTTLLRCLAGLDRPDAGRIEFRGAVWFDAAAGTHVAARKRGVGFVPQDGALFPHLSVAKNVAYGLFARPAAAREERLREMLALARLEALADRWPATLSGGERQRVALARALAPAPRLLLLDEPLSSLDAAARSDLRRELRRVLLASRTPAVVVTHDRVEAAALGDDLILLDRGRVLQQGRLAEVFAHPAGIEASRVLGAENLVSGVVAAIEAGVLAVRVAAGEPAATTTMMLAAVDEGGVAVGAEVALCFRAEEVHILRHQPGEGMSARNRIAARVVETRDEGPVVSVRLDAGFPLTALVTRAAREELSLAPGVEVIALVKATAVHAIAR
ncbi:MAG: ATP-binding cassette domain-containing protein [Planctomycetes bacterium]|nr:ATP-binding cassette domain-containing protein [Planctomycetota bacterium]